MNESQVWQVAPYAIQRTVTVDSQTLTHRYEAPSAEEVIRLARMAGETDIGEPEIVESNA